MSVWRRAVYPPTAEFNRFLRNQRTSEFVLYVHDHCMRYFHTVEQKFSRHDEGTERPAVTAVGKKWGLQGMRLTDDDRRQARAQRFAARYQKSRHVASKVEHVLKHLPQGGYGRSAMQERHSVMTVLRAPAATLATGSIAAEAFNYDNALSHSEEAEESMVQMLTCKTCDP